MADDLTADIDFTPRLQKAYFEIQKLRLPAARKLIEAERKDKPANAFIPYLDNYADLHYLLIAEDKVAYKSMSAQESLRLNIVGKMSDHSPYKRFLLAEIRLHWAFAKLKYGDQVSGSWEIIKAYKLLEENRKKFPDFIPTLKSLGLLHILIGSIPDNYAWVAKIIGLKGSIQNGINELRLVQKEEPFFRQEAELIDLLIHAYTLKLTPDQQKRIRQWPDEQPDNLLLHFFATTVLMKEGQSEQALTFLHNAPRGDAYVDFPFLQYLKGEIELQKGQYMNAAREYSLFQKQYHGFNYVKDSYFKLFMCHWLAGRDSEATAFAKKISGAGETIIEADQLADRIGREYLAGQIGIKQKILYKARYAFDGGYLEEASAALKNISESTFETVPEKAEFNYRKARILQKSGQTTSAIQHYERCLQLTKDTSPGFGASSALHLAYIYLEKNQKQTSIGYFKKAMRFKKHEYKNSIDNKARAALTDLGE
ncbi:tetratricopeptide repeat protein [Dyadobacter sp. UC 10]|nr:tetratricopeptide repeat protein [Dyadobacter sp. UC 10]